MAVGGERGGRFTEVKMRLLAGASNVTPVDHEPVIEKDDTKVKTDTGVKNIRCLSKKKHDNLLLHHNLFKVLYSLLSRCDHLKCNQPDVRHSNESFCVLWLVFLDESAVIIFEKGRNNILSGAQKHTNTSKTSSKTSVHFVKVRRFDFLKDT